MEGVSSNMLLAGIHADKKACLEKQDVASFLETSQPEVLVTLGAGDIDRLVPGIAAWNNSRPNPTHP
jgi:UDP-N-acetylmuramate--alanine ligase